MLGLGGGNGWSGMEGFMVGHRWAMGLEEENRGDKGSLAQAVSAGQLRSVFSLERVLGQD